MSDISPKLLFTVALGGYKVKGASLNASKLEQEVAEFMERNKCYLVLEDGKLTWKDNEQDN